MYEALFLNICMCNYNSVYYNTLTFYSLICTAFLPKISVNIEKNIRSNNSFKYTCELKTLHADI